MHSKLWMKAILFCLRLTVVVEVAVVPTMLKEHFGEEFFFSTLKFRAGTRGTETLAIKQCD